jgi:hypothetical protein
MGVVGWIAGASDFFGCFASDAAKAGVAIGPSAVAKASNRAIPFLGASNLSFSVISVLVIRSSPALRAGPVCPKAAIPSLDAAFALVSGRGMDSNTIQPMFHPGCRKMK